MITKNLKLYAEDIKDRDIREQAMQLFSDCGLEENDAGDLDELAYNTLALIGELSNELVDAREMVDSLDAEVDDLQDTLEELETD